VQNFWKNRWTWWVVFLSCLLPLAWLAWRWYNHDLTANRTEFVARYTGRWAIKMLMISLAVTPLRRIPGFNGLITFRRMLGLYAFFYGVIHLLHYVVLDLRLDWSILQEDLTTRRFFIAGMAALVLMVPLAITSTKGWIRRLGKNWARLHKLVYLSLIIACVHYIWQWKGISIPVLYYPAIALLLLLARVFLAGEKRLAKARRQAGQARQTQRSPV
jgi:methionine sulfoxide reductase heme-binding subunit